MTRKNKFLPSAFGLLAVLFAVSCSDMKAAPDESVARDFMDTYYVKADLKGAEPLADGLALDKVKGSVALREGLSIDANVHQPRVSYKLLESRRAGPEESDFFYEVEFRPEKSEAVVKKTRIKVRVRDGKWKVTQFTDHDL